MAAAAGRKSAPASLKLLKGRAPGTDSAGRKVKTPPAFVRLPPEPPDWLGDEAQAEWRRVVPELQRLHLVKPIDGAALAAYCEVWETFVRATKEVHRSGLVMENRSVKKDGTESVWFTQNPAVALQNTAQASLRAWCSEFGLTPAAESKVGGKEQARDKEDDPFT